jgi:hypothetical protein
MHRSTGSQTADFLDANIALWLAKPPCRYATGIIVESRWP